jgi:DNA modification methylase
MSASEWKNQLFYGDNLEVLRRDIPDASVDLVYLDPPFNSNRNYNVLFQHKDGSQANAQIQAFDDTWTWSQDDEVLYLELIGGQGAAPRIADALVAFHKLLGPSDMLSYLVMMAARLLELDRVLKPDGSLFLHCDPTASHYLKILLDAVFGPDRFRNEIVWHYFNKMQGNVKRLASDHDVIFWYSKSSSFTFNPVMVLREDGPKKMLKRRWDSETKKLVNDKDADGKVQYIERTHRMADDVWRLPMLQPASREKLGYPTQKPVALLERIVEMASEPGDVVLDPFCGCGTALDAAQRLGRRWIGIDITWLAVDLIESRLEATYGADIDGSYVVHGIPVDVEGARALFQANPFDFERWAVSFVDGQPNDRQRGDRGIDGRVRFFADRDGSTGEMLISVKGGTTLNPAMMRDLRGVVERERAEMGLLITLSEPTRGMVEEANRSGTYTRPMNNKTYPRLQIITVEDLLGGKRPMMPEPLNPYVKARPADADQLAMDIG